MELDTTEVNRLQAVFSRPTPQMRSSLSLFRGHQGGAGAKLGGRVRLLSTSVLYLHSVLVNRIFSPIHVTGSLLQNSGPPDVRTVQLSGSQFSGIKEQLDFAL